MLETEKNGKLYFPATQRNRNTILNILKRFLPENSWVLEIASGSGEHAVYFQKNLKNCLWQSSDNDPKNLASISAWIDSECLEMPPPLKLDAAAPSWKLPYNLKIQSVVCINMFHIVPWACCVGFLRNAAKVIDERGILYLYGPYKVRDVPLSEGNLRFDKLLKSQNSSWGLRYLDKINSEAESFGLRLKSIIKMPSNNLSVIFSRAG